ncbi:MAG: DUF4393 domain-containing protein [Clostridia bacterium]|nr:DUF4393 domain-containing protein [Clostridia bacterium]
MFEEQIAAYLKPYCTQQDILEQISVKIGNRIAEQPCKPVASIAGHVMLHYSWAEETQKELYAALLAASMHTEKRTQVHPAFVSIVSQMDDTDMELLDIIRKQHSMPVEDCYFSHMKKGGGFTGKPEEDIASSVQLIARMTKFLPQDGDYERIQAAIDNVIRLQLVEIHMDAERQSLEQIQDNQYEDIYMLFQQVVDGTVKQLCDRYPQYKGRIVRLHTGNMILTAFGTRFLRVCK